VSCIAISPAKWAAPPPVKGSFTITIDAAQG
jgi:hypothetical protein